MKACCQEAGSELSAICAPCRRAFTSLQAQAVNGICRDDWRAASTYSNWCVQEHAEGQVTEAERLGLVPVSGS